jgi:thiol-disulfide isomerase/thioredoxin
VKKTVLAILVILHGSFLMAQEQQQQPDLPPFQRFPTIPPFKLLKGDSATYLTRDDIKKHHLTLIMCFSPECDHCKHQTEDLISAMDKFKDVEIVMATFQPLSEMKEFYRYYRIADYPNIKMGRDDKYVLPPFYKIRNLPFLALYDKKGNLITTFEGNQDVGKLLKAFKKQDK